MLLSYTDLAMDPRVIKHFEALKDNYHVYTAGNSPIGREAGFTEIREHDALEIFSNRLSASAAKRPVNKLMLKLLNFFRFKVMRPMYYQRYWNNVRRSDLRKLKKAGQFDLVVCNDLNTLPLGAALLKKNGKLLYDAHEYHAEEYAESPFWVHYNKPLVQYLYRRYIAKADTCITVGENIAKRYQDDYQKKFSVIYNSPAYRDLPVREATLSRIKLVHTGMYGKNRNIGELFKAMEILPINYELNLLITNPNDELRQLIDSSPARQRIILHPAVPVADVAKVINQYDIGVHLMASVNFNNDNALPNKYFQYMQARLVTVFGPLSEIKEFTNRHETGIILKGFTSHDLAEGISELTVEEINRIKKKNDENSRVFCEENEVKKLKEIYKYITQ